jgi:dihydroxyacetone kinase
VKLTAEQIETLHKFRRVLVEEMTRATGSMVYEKDHRGVRYILILPSVPEFEAAGVDMLEATAEVFEQAAKASRDAVAEFKAQLARQDLLKGMN